MHMFSTNSFLWTVFMYFSSNEQMINLKNGKVIYVNANDQRGPKLMEAHGDLNPLSLEIWKRLLSLADYTHIYDVGANYGEMLANVVLPSQAKIFAVEPNPYVRYFLKKTLKQNQIPANIITEAVSDSVGTVIFSVDTNWSGSSQFSNEWTSSCDKRFKEIKTNTITLSSLILKEGDPKNIYPLFKIDVEAQEIKALKGIMDILPLLMGFTAMIEVMHLQEDDLEWIQSRFKVYAYNLTDEKLEKISLKNPEKLKSVLSNPSYFSQDIVIASRDLPL